MVRKGYYRFAPIYFDDETIEIFPRKMWLSKILDLVIWWDLDVCPVDEFKLKLMIVDENDK